MATITQSNHPPTTASAPRPSMIKAVVARRLSKESTAIARQRPNSGSAYTGAGTVKTAAGGTLKVRLNTSAAVGIGETVQVETRMGSAEAYVRTQPR